MIKSKQELKYYLERDRVALKRSKRWYKDPIWKYEILLRKQEFYANVDGIGHKILCKICGWKRNRLGQQCGGFSIAINSFGPGLSIAHFGSVVVNSTARIGKNCRIHEGVTIGATNGNDKAAIIGDNCFIGSGAKIIGNITIGSDVAIGANACVVRSFSENKITLGGVPARKISNHDSRINLCAELFNERE